MSTPAPDPGVYISPAQTHAEVRRIADGQIRMESKIDAILADQRDYRDTQTDHESRIRSLEAKVFMAMGAAPLLGAGGGAPLAQVLGR
ncbi:hypothetical protein [Kitasatospora sp. NPDC059571]|uniref:hypothetical protein n=1 Tax=Kitasatospora sp. NPDC059571 TaxID=3346871 RepID=UPI00367BF3B4